MTDRVLGLIPARSGSKRIPEKNVREVGGKPLIAHTIDQASAATTIDRAILSTEDEEIAAVATDYGGDVPFQRPEELATDTARNHEVVTHALNWMESQGKQYDYICLLQVTTPFRTAEDIDNAVAQLCDSEMTSLVSVVQYHTPPVWALEKDERDGRLESAFDDSKWVDARSQETPTLYHPNGAIFIAEVSAFREEETFYTAETTGYEMPASRSLDIDEPFDLEMARALMVWRANQ